MWWRLWPWQILLSNLNWPPNLCVRTWESSRHLVAKLTKNACRDFDINCQAQIPFQKNPWVQQSPQKEGIGLGNITTGKNIEMIFNFSWWFLQSGLCLGLSIVECMAWDSRGGKIMNLYKTKSWFPRKCWCFIIAKSVELKILLQLYHQDEVLIGSNSMVLILILLLLLRNLCHTDRQMDGH